ncbi:MAG: hypothetical protein HKO59_17565, partial [Phycisphaerales bacterium]|nr:hypothetical protein [Phycisphaerales bacterium]
MADAAESTDSKRKLPPLKSMIVVAILLVGEAAVLVGAMMFIGKDPDVAAANDAELDPILAEQEKIVEVLVLDAKLPNAKSGVSYLYSTE